MESPHARETLSSERLILDSAHNKANNVFRHEINMEKFASPEGNYDPEMVAHDKALVDSLKEKYEAQFKENQALKDAHQVSDVFEAMVADQIKKNNWFGGGAEMIASSEYDDFINHVDGILYFKVPGSTDYLALSTDITFSGTGMESKIRHVKDKIRDGKMARVKYFELPDGSFKGQLDNVPHIVIGAESKTVLKMAEQWITEGGEKYIGKHWMQAQLLDMAIMQCLYFTEYAKGVENTSAIEKYSYMGDKLKRIRTMREKIVGKLPTDRDGMFFKMQTNLGLR